MGLEVQAEAYPRVNKYYYPPKKAEPPTITGLLIIFIAEILIIVGYFSDDFLLRYFYYWASLTTLGIIGIVLAFIGFMHIYRDRSSYPEPHPNNMRQALLFYIFGIIFSFFPFVLVLILLVSLNGADNGVLRAIFYSVSILSLIGPLLWFFGGYKVLSDLIPFSKKILMKIALWIFVIAIALSFVQFIIIFSPLHYFPHLIASLTRNLYILSHIFFTICFFFAYDFQKNNPQLRRSSR